MADEACGSRMTLLENSAMNSSAYDDIVTRYLALLEAGDVDGMAALFSEQGQVYSPFLGWMSPRPFFAEVVGASGQSRIETLDILVSAQGAPRAIGYFIYHWQLKDCTFVHFNCADVFDFDARGRIARMTIVYDTHPVRAQVGNKYGCLHCGLGSTTKRHVMRAMR